MFNNKKFSIVRSKNTVNVYEKDSNFVIRKHKKHENKCHKSKKHHKKADKKESSPVAKKERSSSTISQDAPDSAKSRSSSLSPRSKMYKVTVCSQHKKASSSSSFEFVPIRRHHRHHRSHNLRSSSDSSSCNSSSSSSSSTSIHKPSTIPKKPIIPTPAPIVPEPIIPEPIIPEPIIPEPIISEPVILVPDPVPVVPVIPTPIVHTPPIPVVYTPPIPIIPEPVIPEPPVIPSVPQRKTVTTQAPAIITGYCINGIAHFSEEAERGLYLDTYDGSIYKWDYEHLRQIYPQQHFLPCYYLCDDVIYYIYKENDIIVAPFSEYNDSIVGDIVVNKKNGNIYKLSAAWTWLLIN